MSFISSKKYLALKVFFIFFFGGGGEEEGKDWISYWLYCLKQRQLLLKVPAFFNIDKLAANLTMEISANHTHM